MSEQSQPYEFGYVYTCYDPLIRDEILRYCEERFGKGNYFFDSDPGAAKNLVAPHEQSDVNFVVWKMQLALNVHPYTTMLLIAHSNCGAEADAGMVFVDPEVEIAHHKPQLEKAVAFLKTKLPAHIKIEQKYFLKKEQKFAW